MGSDPLCLPLACPFCGYDLAAAPVSENAVTCPECGKSSQPDRLRERTAVQPFARLLLVMAGPWLSVIGILVLLVLPGLFVSIIVAFWPALLIGFLLAGVAHPVSHARHIAKGWYVGPELRRRILSATAAAIALNAVATIGAAWLVFLMLRR